MEELKKEFMEEAKALGLDAAEETILKAWSLIIKFVPLYLAQKEGILKALAPIVLVVDEPIKQMIDEINGRDDV